MKKKIILSIVLLIIIIISIVGVIILIDNKRFNSSNNNDNNNNNNLSSKIGENAEIVEFNERLFLAQVDDVYINMEDYEGKYIKYTGFVYNVPETDDFVIAREYFCCGDDSTLVGFEAITDEKFQNDTWVTVTGKIVLSDKYEYLTPIMEVVDIEKATPGERYVYY